MVMRPAEQFENNFNILLKRINLPIRTIGTEVEKVFSTLFGKQKNNSKNTNFGEFSMGLTELIHNSMMKPQEMFHIIENCIANQQHGPLNFVFLKKRNFPRRLKRPECQRFHEELKMAFPIEILDFKLYMNRGNSRRKKPTIFHERETPRKIERRECRKFHKRYGEIPDHFIDKSGPSARAKVIP